MSNDTLVVCWRHVGSIFLPHLRRIFRAVLHRIRFFFITLHREVYSILIENNQLLIEECIKQHEDMNRLYSKSVNTMRMFTFYKNGNSYYGYYSKNKKNGYGKYKYITNGEVYEGYFVNDKKQGIGRYFYSNGDIYTGYLFDDLRNGFGIIKFNNGDWYQGMFVKDIRHGIGIYYEKKGDEYYLGEWVEDKKEGVATIYNQNWYYNGSVKNGIKDGYCTFIFEDNIYTGPFKDNMWEGYGTLIMSKESQIYTGLFIKGKMPPSVTKKSISDDFEELKL